MVWRCEMGADRAKPRRHFDLRQRSRFACLQARPGTACRRQLAQIVLPSGARTIAAGIVARRFHTPGMRPPRALQATRLEPPPGQIICASCRSSARGGSSCDRNGTHWTLPCACFQRKARATGWRTGAGRRGRAIPRVALHLHHGPTRRGPCRPPPLCRRSHWTRLLLVLSHGPGQDDESFFRDQRRPYEARARDLVPQSSVRAPRPVEGAGSCLFSLLINERFGHGEQMSHGGRLP